MLQFLQFANPEERRHEPIMPPNAKLQNKNSSMMIASNLGS
jgi:hypothetical protein